MEVYLVGGAVRDEYLGVAIKERDWVVVGASHEEMEELGFVKVGKSFPVYFHPETKEEYALARTEKKVAGGYHGFKFNTSKKITLEDDLKRRDLTINAMAKNANGEIIDPYGGLKDLADRVLRHVSDAFIEDPVRVLRVARFAASYEHFGFSLAPETEALMHKMVLQGELDYLVPERVWQEMVKALSSGEPVAFIRVLHQCGALNVVLPEFGRLYGVPQESFNHPEVDTGAHTELVLRQAAHLSPKPEIRFAALCHDVGKAMTPRGQWPKHFMHEQKGCEVVDKLCDRLKIPNKYRELAKLALNFYQDVYEVTERTTEDVLKILERSDAIRRPDRFKDMLLVCKAVYRGRLGNEHDPFTQAELLSDAIDAVTQINAKDVLKDVNIKEDEIKQAIYSARIDAVKRILDN